MSTCASTEVPSAVVKSTVLGTSVDADVDIDPLVVGIGFGYKF